jgi:hypothetical protein
MYKVYRILCNTDWKGRADHILTLVAKVATQEYAVEALTADVEKCKVNDISDDNQMALEMAEDDGEPAPEPITVWENDNRFEMERTDNDSTRILCYTMGGDFASVSWRIVEEVD